MANDAAPVFPAEAILTSQKYRKYVDLLRMKLKPGRDYSFAEVDGIIEAFMKAPVKEARVGRKR